MTEIEKKSKVEIMIHDLEKPLTMEKRCKLLGEMSELLQSQKEDPKFKNAVYSMVNSIQHVFINQKSPMKYYGESLWKALDFVFTYQKKVYYLKSTSFLSSLKMELNEEQLEILENKHKVNFNTKDIRENLFNLNYQTYIPKAKALKLSSIDTLVDELHDYIRKNRVNDTSIEKLYEKHKDLLLLNLKSFYSMKVSDKDLIATFNSILTSENNTQDKCKLMDNFVELFTETNIFKNSFAPLKKPASAMVKFFDKEIKKSLYETEAQKKLHVGNRNIINANQEVIQYFVNHPSIMHPNLQYKLERKQKLEMFEKLNLNEVEQNQLNQINEEKSKIGSKKIKI